MYIHYFNSNVNMNGGAMPMPIGAAAGVAASAAGVKVDAEGFTDKIFPYLCGCCVFCCILTIIGFIANIVITNKQAKDPTNTELASQRTTAFTLFQICLVMTVCMTMSIGIIFQQGT